MDVSYYEFILCHKINSSFPQIECPHQLLKDIWK